MNRKMLCLIITVSLMANICVNVSYTLELRGYDPSLRNTCTYFELSTGERFALKNGEAKVIKGKLSYKVAMRMETGWAHFEKNAKPHVRVSLRKMSPGKPEPVFCLLLVGSKRKVILNYPPASSPWNLPAGIAYLTPILRSNGHKVIQRYGHIIGTEHLLRQYGSEGIDNALRAIRDPESDIFALYDARIILERVSGSIPTDDKFVVERNNVRYISVDYDGTIEGVIRAVHSRESNIWYKYLIDVEIPLALDFKPDIYGISIADERQLIQGCILASLIKDASPQTLIVLGGNFWARVIPTFALPEFLKMFNFCDAIVYREGFQPLQELVASMKPSIAPGTVWKNGDQVVVNAPPTTPTEFETLPTPEFDGGAHQWSPDDVYPLHTMSNCPMACGFCAIAAGSDTYLSRPRSMCSRKIAEHMAKLGHRFDIMDETFSIKRQLALGEELKRIGHKAEWQCYLTVTNELLNHGKCHQLYEAGCRAVQLGLETLSPDTLHREHKSWNHPENYANILANLKAAGMQNHVFLITGLPGEPLHHSLRWLPFLDQYGDSILTIKAGRYRLPKMSPEDQEGTHSKFVKVLPDTKPLHLNRDFRYCEISRKKVEATRDILEQACREHWAYGVTSTVPWWINRGRYSWTELRQMEAHLPKEKPVPHLRSAIRKIRGIIREELNQEVSLSSFEDLLEFSQTI